MKIDESPTPLPTLKADLLLLHAPAFFDFRERRDVYFPFLGTSGDVPITPLYEYFPLGFKALQRFLRARGHAVEILNLSTLLLLHPRLELERIVAALDVGLLGIDLHWMVHAQGSLAVAARVKDLRPDLPVIFGGISSSYYAEELIRYRQVDMVMRGYDTLVPMGDLLAAMKAGRGLGAIPNLLWKSRDGQIHDNGVSHAPRSFGCGIDWSTVPSGSAASPLGIREILSTQNAGCAQNCGWCGGGRDAFQRVFKSDRFIAHKSEEEIAYEFGTLRGMPDLGKYHYYSVGSYNQPPERLASFIERVAELRLGSVNYEQFHLTPEDTLRRMASANRRTSITLSPESHDVRIGKLAGRGVYTNEELERWLERALHHGIRRVDIWYFVGMPEQDERSVQGTLKYCERLLDRFPGGGVHPMICPMIPFLDPGSNFFTEPERHGYRLFCRTLEEHRAAAERASPIHRVNYETRWLRREEIVQVGFRAVRSLMQAKATAGMFPAAWIDRYVAQIDDAIDFMKVVHAADSLAGAAERTRALGELGDEILRRNGAVLCAGVMNQAFPATRQIGGRWFDEVCWPLA